MKTKNRLENSLIEHTLNSAPYYNPAPPEVNNKDNVFITAEMQIDFKRILSKYPNEQKQSSLIPILTLCQVYNGGYLTEKIVQEVADYLEIEAIKVFEIATFYSLFNHQPQGKYQLCVCQGVSCLLNGYSHVLEAIMQKLETLNETNIEENSIENLFSIKKVECLGACGGAPVIRIGDEYHENLTPKSVMDLMDSLTKK